MFVLIVGGGRTGTQLARLLINEHYDIRVVESRRDILVRMHRELPTEVIYEGSEMDPHVLEQAGIRNADVLAACTTSDEQNLVLCYLGKEAYRVGRTIARVNNPANAWVFNSVFKVDVAVNQAELLSRLIEEEMSMGDMMTLLKLRRGNYSLVEEKVPAGAKAIGIPIKDMGLPENCVIAAIIRNGEVTVPRGITSFNEGDEVLAVTDDVGTQLLCELLSPKG